MDPFYTTVVHTELHMFTGLDFLYSADMLIDYEYLWLDIAYSYLNIDLCLYLKIL